MAHLRQRWLRPFRFGTVRRMKIRILHAGEIHFDGPRDLARYDGVREEPNKFLEVGGLSGEPIQRGAYPPDPSRPSGSTHASAPVWRGRTNSGTTARTGRDVLNYGEEIAARGSVLPPGDERGFRAHKLGKLQLDHSSLGAKALGTFRQIVARLFLGDKLLHAARAPEIVAFKFVDGSSFGRVNPHVLASAKVFGTTAIRNAPRSRKTASEPLEKTLGTQEVCHAL